MYLGSLPIRRFFPQTGRVLASFFFLVTVAFAQTRAPLASSVPLGAAQTGASGGGLRAPWDLVKTLDALAANANRLRPVVEQVNPKEWLAKGAPEGYIDQHQLVVGQLRSVAYIAQLLSKDPEKLTLVLDLFFRIESLDLNLLSFSEGTRTYHNPAAAELMEGMRAEGAAARSGLREYVVELAANKEQEFKIVDNEAQKCRTQQLRAPRRR